MQVMELLPQFNRSVQAAQARQEGKGDDNDDDDDQETTKGIARLFAEVGEAYTTLIASGTPLFTLIINMPHVPNAA